MALGLNNNLRSRIFGCVPSSRVRATSTETASGRRRALNSFRVNISSESRSLPLRFALRAKLGCFNVGCPLSCSNGTSANGRGVIRARKSM